jgi:endonuclease/exonuclease/phosphatase family metal-dependent hydrolase
MVLLEVDAGSIRNRFHSQVKRFSKRLKYPFYNSCIKYHPDSFWSRVIYFRKQHDAIMSKEEGKYHCHYLKTGMKKLVQEYIINGVSIFSIHMAVLSSVIRKQQFEELLEILKKCPRPFMLCGDFNIHGGLYETEEFLKKSGLRRLEMEPTFPSHKPTRHLDLFFVSRNLNVKDCGVTKSLASDHRPVWVEI